ncbi:DUF393 domain-containing protein [bacterium]|nr:MAG: DUF393 domain-containing protein [bacterium]
MLWVLRHDRYGNLKAIPNQEADISPELRAECQKALHVIKSDGQIIRAGRAALFCGQQTRWHQLARIGQWPIFIPFIEIGYAIVAKNRALLSKYFFTKEDEFPQNKVEPLTCRLYGKS